METHDLREGAFGRACDERSTCRNMSAASLPLGVPFQQLSVATPGKRLADDTIDLRTCTT